MVVYLDINTDHTSRQTVINFYKYYTSYCSTTYYICGKPLDNLII